MAEPVDPLRQYIPLLGPARRALEAQCQQLRADLAALDDELTALIRRRRTLAANLSDARTRLVRTLRFPARRPAPDGSEQLPPIEAKPSPLSGRRLRSVCLALLRKLGPLPLTELHALLHQHGYVIDSRHPVKCLADTMGYEVDHARALRVARGKYAAAPPSAAA